MATLRRAKIVLITLISAHSLILGAAMLFWPAQTLAFFGWDYVGPMFFPSQTGIFLVLFAGGYLAGLWNPAFITFMLASKTAAVIFLLTEYVLLGSDAPGTVLAAAVLDGLMGAAMASLWILEYRQRLKSAPTGQVPREHKS